MGFFETLESVKADIIKIRVYTVNIFTVKFPLSDIPKLPQLAGGETPPEEEEEDDDESQNNKPSKQRRPSGPRAKDPYAADDTSTMLLPVFVAIGAFIPLLFCLCKL